jgi:hypothetical protein
MRRPDAPASIATEHCWRGADHVTPPGAKRPRADAHDVPRFVPPLPLGR